MCWLSLLLGTCSQYYTHSVSTMLSLCVCVFVCVYVCMYVLVCVCASVTPKGKLTRTNNKRCHLLHQQQQKPRASCDFSQTTVDNNTSPALSSPHEPTPFMSHDATPPSYVTANDWPCWPLSSDLSSSLSSGTCSGGGGCVGEEGRICGWEGV